MMSLRCGITENKTQAVIEMFENDRVLGHIIYDIPEFEGLLKILSNQRAGLVEKVPTELDPGTRVDSILDPAWRTVLSKEAPGILLALRHPGYGWIGNLLPPHEAQALGQSLLQLSGTPPSASS